MGTFSVPIEVGDIQGNRFEGLDVLVDTGATATMIASSVLQRLGIAPVRRQAFVYANGERVQLEMGEVRVRVEGRETPTWVIFGAEGAMPLLGAHALEGVFLGVDPIGQRLIPVDGLLK